MNRGRAMMNLDGVGMEETKRWCPVCATKLAPGANVPGYSPR